MSVQPATSHIKPALETAARQQRNLLLVLFVGVLIGALDIAIVGPALPAIGRTFGVDERGLAWVFNIYVLLGLVGSLVMGKLSDRYGRRNVFLGNIGLFAVGSLIVALSPNFALMLTGRALQGFAAGGIFPVASAVIGDTFPEERRGRALGLIGAVFGIAFLVGPILGGVLLIFGWHWLFLVNLPVAAWVITQGLRLLPNVVLQKSLRFDWLGMGIFAVMVTGLTIGVSQLDTGNLGASLLSPQVGGALLVALIALPVFITVQQRVSDPIIPPQLSASRQLILANLVSVGAGIGEASVVFLPAMAVIAFGVSTSTASFLALPMVLGMACASPLAGRGLDKYGSKVVILSSSAVVALGMLILATVGGQMWGYLLGSVVVGAGLGGLLGAPLRYIMLTEAPVKHRASAQSMITVYTGIGQMLGGALLGALIASLGSNLGGYLFAYTIVAALSVCLTLTALALKNRAQELDTPKR
jgi:MFS family permease